MHCNSAAVLVSFLSLVLAHSSQSLSISERESQGNSEQPIKAQTHREREETDEPQAACLLFSWLAFFTYTVQDLDNETVLPSARVGLFTSVSTLPQLPLSSQIVLGCGMTTLTLITGAHGEIHRAISENASNLQIDLNFTTTILSRNQEHRTN